MKIFKKQGSNICFIIIVFALLLLPILLMNNIISSSSFVSYVGRCICFAIVAMGLDLIWGYTGILSLGHGLYFSLGGYAMAMYLKLDRTQGGLTDFMQTGGLDALPWFWVPFKSGFLTVVLLMAIPAVVAGLIGYFMFKSRVKGVYFSIISQALTWAMYSLFTALSPFTGGNNGITDISSIFGSIRGDKNKGNLILLFYIAVLCLVVLYVVAKFLVSQKFGKILVAIRDGENRTYFSGYRVSKYKTFIYVVSAVFAAIAGALFVNFNGSITPTQMTISYSITMVIWVAVGGRGTIVGAVIGAFLINLCEYQFSTGDGIVLWQYLIGIIFCITVLFFKGGIVGIFKEQIPAMIRKMQAKKEVVN
ncbi:MAG: urea ABC transporter permease subunit UrtC [Lachnospiraceae bacterium]